MTITTTVHARFWRGTVSDTRPRVTGAASRYEARPITLAARKIAAARRVARAERRAA